MLLELCEIPLTNWLHGIADVTTDQIEDMFRFVQGIARGVEYLHSKTPPVLYTSL